MAVSAWSQMINLHVLHLLVIGMGTIVTGSSIRLYGGSSDKEGAVQVNVEGEWRNICNDGWDAVDALVTCRQLGFTEGYALIFNGDLYDPDISLNKPERETFLTVGTDFACNGSEESLLTCNYTKYGGYCGQWAGAVCDITPQQFYELITHIGQYKTLLYTIAPNGLVLAVQRQQTRTRVLGGVCNMDDRTASMICDEYGYHYGGKPTNLPVLENLPIVVSKVSCSDAYWLGDCQVDFSTDGLCDGGAYTNGVKCYTTPRPSVIGSLAYAALGTIFIVLAGAFAIHWIRKWTNSHLPHSNLTEIVEDTPSSKKLSQT
ncbi:deleted in malignant brain tumors 1 protein-like [Strongylocentrotus purpuratus]|uniref:SRCR domain-containing protein n=1 Tax=Strongylocentrotus purpuratus TaxID=7668 RepID=A0A7M7HK97_STRPU|nr:deleted in malignant brain tumors 1 protein-like [Strongylocentrotus purpuratus]|eukprot:XP_011667208.1 PREDICTED: deleted in malignant brain tumors 1 protein-like [Strongylocentrotus purpuratus]